MLQARLSNRKHPNRATLLPLPPVMSKLLPLGPHQHQRGSQSLHGQHQPNSGSQLPRLPLKVRRNPLTANKSVDRFSVKPTLLQIHSIVLLYFESLQSCMITLPLFFLTVANPRSFIKFWSNVNWSHGSDFNICKSFQEFKVYFIY